VRGARQPSALDDVVVNALERHSHRLEEFLFLELHDPPPVTDEMLIESFDRIPGTQNPPRVPEDQALRLLHLVGVEL
jgi:hypothetical protein